MRSYDVRKTEARWQRVWEDAGCHRAPRLPGPTKYFVHDSAPSPNGPLHLGHVRTYVLGDMTARYQRLLGKSVLYHTGFDAFGLPIELEAIEQAISPRRLVEQSIETMTRQLKQLGISYDWSLIPTTCDPACYRWTQWLFLEMYDAGIVERREAPVSYCLRCETTLARLQIEEGCCWRCGSEVGTRQLRQWFIATSSYTRRLRDSLEKLDQWSRRAKNMVAGLLDETLDARESRSGRLGDWLVSRQRSWGTPIPLIHCDRCGVVPVPRSQLPVVLPEDLDWGSGSGALSRNERFTNTTCPVCQGSARRETDTLDCFFDDTWCFLQALTLRAKCPGLTRENLLGWLPVDRYQSGFDTIVYLHLYRFLGLFLQEHGILDDPEIVRSFLGNELVLSRGRKMGKHLGNAISPHEILETFGADALRVAMLWAAGPQRAVEWEQDLLEKAAAFLDSIHELVRSVLEGEHPGPSVRPPSGGSRAAQSLQATGARTVERVGRFIEECRPNAAIEDLATLGRAIGRFAERRVRTGRLTLSDVVVLDQVTGDLLIALAPFAPHLAEECWAMLGNESLVCCARWPAGRTNRRRSGARDRTDSGRSR